MTSLPPPSTAAAAASPTASAAHARAAARTTGFCGAPASRGAPEGARISSARTAGGLSIAYPVASTSTVARTSLLPTTSSTATVAGTSLLSTSSSTATISCASPLSIALLPILLPRIVLTVRSGCPAGCAAILTRRLPIRIRRSAAVLRIVLPAVASSTTGLLRGTIAVTDVLAVRVVNEVVIVIDVYVVVSSAPSSVVAPTSTPSCPDSQANTERDRHSRRVIAGRRIIDGWVGISWRAVHHHRVVAGNVDDLRIGLLDHDHLFAFYYPRFNLHLLIGFEVPLFLCLRSHALHCIHGVVLLRQECVAEFRGPLDVIHQALDHIRKRGHGLDAWVPRLLLHRVSERFVLQSLVFLQPLLELNKLQRVRRGGENLSEQRIWVQRDRSD